MTDEVNAIIKKIVRRATARLLPDSGEDMVEVLEPSEIYRVFAEFR